MADCVGGQIVRDTMTTVAHITGAAVAMSPTINGDSELCRVVTWRAADYCKRTIIAA